MAGRNGRLKMRQSHCVKKTRSDKCDCLAGWFFPPLKTNSTLTKLGHSLPACKPCEDKDSFHPRSLEKCLALGRYLMIVEEGRNQRRKKGRKWGGSNLSSWILLPLSTWGIACYNRASPRGVVGIHWINVNGETPWVNSHRTNEDRKSVPCRNYN